MSIPNEHNNQNNYDEYMAEVQDPRDHPVDNIPSPQEDHWGTELPTGTQPMKQQKGSEGGPKKETVGMQALAALKAKLEGGSTKTKGKK